MEAGVQVDALDVLADEHERLQCDVCGGVLDAAPEREHVVGDITLRVDVIRAGGTLSGLGDVLHRELDVLQQPRRQLRAQHHGVVERGDDGGAHRVGVRAVVEEGVDEPVEVLEILR